MALIAGPTIAADLSVYAPALNRMPPTVRYDPWTGFYIGANVGYGAGIWDSDSLAFIFPGSTGFVASDQPNVLGWQGGLQAGFNWQVDGSWLFGFEADIQGTTARTNSDGNAVTITPTLGNNFNLVTTQTSSEQWRLPWFVTLRGRLGGLADAGTLIYVTAGLAAGEFRFASQTTLSAQLFGPGPTGTIPAGPLVTSVGPAFSESAVRMGATAGIGVEQKLTSNWSGKLEYLYLDFGSYSFLSGTGVDTNVRLRENLLRFGVNYTFGPPAATKY